MSVKKVEIPGVGTVTLVKRAHNRNLRLSVSANGDVRVSMPRWTPYSAAAAFASANQAWIQKELATRQQHILEGGQAIGKQHYLRFERVFNAKPAATSRVTKTEVIVRLYGGENEDWPAVQKRARTAASRALKNEASVLLPPRLAELAALHGYSYRSVNIKSLKRRWGSCSSEKAITLNLYLMELPWQYIDYVLLHELNHTKHMDHSPAFWHSLEELLPGARKVSKQLRIYQPQIGPSGDGLSVG